MSSDRVGLAVTLAAAIGLTVLVDPAGAQERNHSELHSALDSAAAAYASDSAVAGVSVAVVHGGETLLHEGYGLASLELDVPMPRDAVFEIGSVTKQFTAAAILQLAARDSLDLDADITEYLPDYDTRGHHVTVRNLLHHTSGIRSYTTMPEFPSLMRSDGPQEKVARMAEKELFRFAPGSAMIYNNTGYYLLGLIIEEVSGLSYARYVETHLFEPAGMESSYYCDEEAVVEGKARGSAWSAEKGLRHSEYWNHKWPYAAGSLCSTTSDMIAWNQALHGGLVLPNRMYELMTRPGHLSDGTRLRYGMGLGLYQRSGRPIIGHSGGTSGFTSNSRYYPEDDLMVIVLQNTLGTTAPSSLSDSLARLVLGPGEQREAPPYEGDLSRLTGRYAGPGRGELLSLHVREKNGALTVRGTTDDAEADTLRHLSGLTWRKGTDRYRFVRTGEQVVELHVDVVGGHYVLRRVGER